MNNSRRGLSQSELELPLMALVARKHYLGGLSKSEIAEQLYLSRFKVARLLDEAKERGIVRFEIGLPGDVNVGLSQELKAAFQLRNAVVIDDADEGQQQLFARLGQATVLLLAETIQTGDLVGIASTRTMMGLPEPSADIPRCSFVQLTGSLPRRDAVDVISGIRSLTQKSKGDALVFYAPMVASSIQARNSYLSQPETRAAFTLFDQLDILVTGIGTWVSELSVIYDNLSSELRDEATATGAVAEIVGVPIDERGRTVHGSAREHIVAPDVEQLLGTRDRIAVVFDPNKAPAVKIALKNGLVNTVVTHRAHAEALLALGG